MDFFEELRKKTVVVGPGVRAGVVSITPKMASAFLEQNTPNNRKLSTQRVVAMAEDMAKGKWVLSHQGLCFDKAMRLIDGQHRCAAIFLSDQTIDMMVTINSGADFNDPIDRGRAREMHLIAGLSKQECSALNVLRQMRAGHPIATPITVANILEEHTIFSDVLKGILSNGSSRWVTGAALAACVWAAPLYPAEVDIWLHKVRTGEMLEAGGGAMRFRRWITLRPRIRAWNIAMAACNGLTMHIQGRTSDALTDSDRGYRFLTTKRRVSHIPHTPSNEVVKSFSGSSYKKNEDE